MSLMILQPSSVIGKLVAAALNVVTLTLAREHVGKYWKRKKKIPLPGMGENNDAIGHTLEVRLNMLYLIGSWLGVAVLELVL